MFLPLELYELLLPPIFPARVAIANTTWSYVRPDAPETAGRSVHKAFARNIDDVVDDDIDTPRLLDYEDRRTWQPVDTSPSTYFGTGGRIRPAESRKSSVPFGLSFSRPNSVLICARRIRRRQSMFARGYYGRLGYTRARRNEFSQISCGR